MKKALLLVVAGIMAVASLASAANREGQFSVSPVIGGYTFDHGQNIDTSLIYGARVGYNLTKHFGVEALFDYVSTEPKNSTTDVNLYRYGGELLYHFFPDNALVPYVAAGFAGFNFDSKVIDNRTHGAFDYGVGAKYFLNDNFALRADVRHIIYRVATFDHYTDNNVEYTVGAYIPFGGVTPAAKPIEPAPAPAPKAVEPPPAPAPAPPEAPTTMLKVTPDSIMIGQSANLNWTSRNATACDIQPGIGAVPPQGARAITPSASTSYTLSCTGLGGSMASAAGITVMVPPPLPVPVVEQPKPTAAAIRFCNKPAILEINFDTNKSDIKPRYHNELKTVGDFLKEFPNAKGEISGHTDSVGSNAANQKLSERRAESVAKYIESTFGIESGRITTKGYGETKPITSNKTKAGKAKNRRIEANFTCQ